jgi:hypothetical protein
MRGRSDVRDAASEEHGRRRRCPLKRLLALLAVSGLSLGPASAAQQAAASGLARPVLKAPVFCGLEKDVVGRLGVARPNGERDGRFGVTLTATGKAVVLKDVVLQRVFARGTSYAEGWDANPGTSASVLAVYLDGRRLNPTDRHLSVRVKPGTHRLELYANDHYGVFAPGQYFRVTAAFAGGTAAASPRTKLPGAAPVVTARFAGLDGDMVGRGVDQKPNGEPDAHFVATLDLRGGWQIVTNVVLRRLTAQGALDVPIYWMQGPQTAGLVINGQRYQWPTEMPWWIGVYVPVNPKAGLVKIDLYANDPTPKGQPSSLFGSGQQYRLTVQFTDSALVGETYTVVHL